VLTAVWAAAGAPSLRIARCRLAQELRAFCMRRVPWAQVVPRCLLRTMSTCPSLRSGDGQPAVGRVDGPPVMRRGLRKR